MLNTPLLIGGQWRDALDGRRFNRSHPMDRDVVSQAAAAGVADACAAADAAQAALPGWAATGPTQRRAALLRAADALAALGPQIAQAMAAETGANAGWAGFNTHLAVDMLREAAALISQIGGQTIPTDLPGSLALTQRRPAGVVLGIAPWNAPVILAVRAVAVALACGNTVVLKGSELCPAVHGLVARAFVDAALPPGVVNLVCNAPEDAAAVVQALIAHPAVRRVNFTGSTRVGRVIAALCAQHLKPSLLELGGKAPLLVLDDADLDAAVDGAIFGAFANAGQICMSTERLIVDAAVADDFVQRLAQRAQRLPAGDPRQGMAVLGPLINDAAAAHCQALVDDALARGARLLCGGRGDGVVWPATLLDHVTPAMRIYHEESFGPVKPIVRVQGVEAAIACANDTEYGLSAAVFSRDLGRAWQVAQRIDSGICHINGATVHDEAPMPFGGTKSSGWGRFGGQAGIEAFTDLRWLTLQTSPRHYPF